MIESKSLFDKVQETQITDTTYDKRYKISLCYMTQHTMQQEINGICVRPSFTCLTCLNFNIQSSNRYNVFSRPHNI